MAINIQQTNTNGNNNNLLPNSGNETKINNKVIWEKRAEGFFTGIIISIIANYIYAFLQNKL
jgi:cellobiose-specific phosphotransferase system component IIC